MRNAAFYPGAKVLAKRQYVANHEEGTIESKYRGNEWMIRWVDGELGVVSENDMAPYPDSDTESSEVPTSVLQRYVLHKQPGELMGIQFNGNKTQAVQAGHVRQSVVSGLMVQRVLPGSPAMRAGVPEGWRVYSLNGELAQSEGAVVKQRNASTVEVEVYPPGETGDTMWLHAHLEGFYRSYDPSMLAHLSDEVRRWAGREGDLQQHLASRYPSSDVSWLSGLELLRLSSTGAPVPPSSLPYPTDPTDMEMGGMSGVQDGKELGFKFDPEAQTWTKRDTLFLVLLVVGVFILIPSVIAYSTFSNLATQINLYVGIAMFLGFMLTTRRQVLIFDDARKELRYGLMRVAFLWFCIDPPMKSVPYRELPSVQTSPTLHGCRVRVNGSQKVYFILKVNGTSLVLGDSDFMSVALGNNSEGNAFEAFISSRRALA